MSTEDTLNSTKAAVTVPEDKRAASTEEARDTMKKTKTSSVLKVEDKREEKADRREDKTEEKIAWKKCTAK